MFFFCLPFDGEQSLSMSDLSRWHRSVC